MDTLPDLLRDNLDLLSIGINPSPRSVEVGYYFAGKQTRFWKALNASGLLAAPVEPSPAAMQTLFDAGIGFTDAVKRPTPNANGLRAADWKQWLPVLDAQLARYRPRIAWFHGKVAWQAYRKHVLGEQGEVPWGEQAERRHGAIVFVSPNPSPANAVFSLEDITGYFRALATLRDQR
jgi:TDG/mug DNA glycosylase family protein